MTLEEFTAAVLAALQADPHNLDAETAQAVLDYHPQPKTMRIMHENETPESAATVLMEGWSAREE